MEKNLRSIVYVVVGILVLLLPQILPSNFWLYMFTLVGIYIMLVLEP